MRNGYASTYHGTVWNVLGTNGILLARSGFTGSQAYPGCWAGDDQPNFGIDGIQGVAIAGQSAAMSGFAIWGHDICGYLDSNWSSTPTNLFERWTQFGALSPIMQMHRQVSLNRQYP
jgi:alpha-D-xyloside xylohydrolase